MRGTLVKVLAIFAILMAMPLAGIRTEARGLLGTKTNFDQNAVYYFDVFQEIQDGLYFKAYAQKEMNTNFQFGEAYILAQDDSGRFRAGPGTYNGEFRFKLEVELWK